MLTQIAPSLFDTSPAVHTPGHRTCVLPRVSETEPTIDIVTLAKAAGVTDRTIRRWVREGLIASPVTVNVPGTGLKLRRWPASVVPAVRGLAERREVWLRR